MRRFLLASISYLVTGAGCYYIYSGGASLANLLLFAVGLTGILFDIFHKKLMTE